MPIPQGEINTASATMSVEYYDEGICEKKFPNDKDNVVTYPNKFHFLIIFSDLISECFRIHTSAGRLTVLFCKSMASGH